MAVAILDAQPQPMPLLIIFLVAVLVRSYFASIASFGGDELAVYRNAIAFFVTGRPAATGARIVYNGTTLPGSLLDLLTGPPLFFSGGLPWATVAWIVALNTAAMLYFYRLYREVFPKTDFRKVALLLLLAPWGYVYATFCNPAFILPLSAIFYWGLWRLFKKPGDARGAAALALSLLLLLQINLSVVALIALIAVLWVIGVIKTPSWKGLLAGGSAGSLTLIPYFLQRLNTPGDSNPFLTSSIHFEWWHVLDSFRVITRFVSFPTGEITRFIGRGDGFRGAMVFVRSESWMWLPFWIAIVVSVALSLLVFLFYCKPSNYRLLYRCLRTRGKSLTATERLRLTALLAPLVAFGLFIFSLKEPSAHTLLVIFPLSFFPLLEWMDRYPSIDRKIPWPAHAAYWACVLAYALPGYQYGYPVSLWKTQELALSSQPIPPEFEPGVTMIRKALKREIP